MNARTQGSLKSSKKKQDLQTHIHTIEDEVLQAQSSVRKSISSSAEKLTLIVPMAARLEKIGKGEKIDSLLDLGRSMGRDIDVYMNEVKDLDTKFEEVKNRPPKNLAKLGRYNAQCMGIGEQYKGLDTRISQNLLPSLEQLFDVAELSIKTDNDQIAVVDKEENLNV